MIFDKGCYTEWEVTLRVTVIVQNHIQLILEPTHPQNTPHPHPFPQIKKTWIQKNIEYCDRSNWRDFIWKKVNQFWQILARLKVISSRKTKNY